MGRIILLCLLCLNLSACVVVSAVGGAAVDGVMYLFKSEKESLPIEMRVALVATQRTLVQMQLQPNIIEPVKDGYIMEFAQNDLEGSVRLTHETGHLTTISVRVQKGVGRAKSIGKAIFEGVREQADKVRRNNRFDFRAYNNIRQAASVDSERVGWYIVGTKLDVSPIKEHGWLRVKMPSGKRGFIKGSIVK